MSTTAPEYILRHVDQENVEYTVYQYYNGMWAVRVYDLDAKEAYAFAVYPTKEQAVAKYNRTVQQISKYLGG